MTDWGLDGYRRRNTRQQTHVPCLLSFESSKNALDQLAFEHASRVSHCRCALVLVFTFTGPVFDEDRNTYTLTTGGVGDGTPHSRPHWTPLTRQYFAIPASGGGGADQFFYFTSLMAWLLQKAGKRFAAPEQHDDPNASCSTLLQTLKDMGFAAPSFPPAKLKQGWGEAVRYPDPPAVLPSSRARRKPRRGQQAREHPARCAGSRRGHMLWEVSLITTYSLIQLPSISVPRCRRPGFPFVATSHGLRPRPPSEFQSSP